MIYYTPAEFSAALDSVLSKETIIRMCKSEEIKSVRRPAKYAHFKIPESELKRVKESLVFRNDAIKQKVEKEGKL